MQNYLIYITIIACLSSGYNALRGCDNNNNNNISTNSTSKRKALKISSTHTTPIQELKDIINPLYPMKKGWNDGEYIPDSESASEDISEGSSNQSSDEEFLNPKSRGFSKSSNQKCRNCPVKSRKKVTSKKNNSTPRRQLKTPGQYYVCAICVGQNNFLSKNSLGRFAGLYETYNSYSTNSRVIHNSIYKKCEENGTGEGARWLKSNCRLLQFNPYLPLTEVVSKFKKQLLKSQELDEALKELEVKKIAHEILEEMKAEDLKNKGLTPQAMFFDEDSSSSSSSDSDFSTSSYSDTEE